MTSASAQRLATEGPEAAELFVQQLARALRQLRTYAPAHVLSVAAIEACHRALVGCVDADSLVLVCSGGSLQVNNRTVSVSTAGDLILLQQMERAGVAELTFGLDATTRELSGLLAELLTPEDAMPLADRLVLREVSRISARQRPRPELVDVEPEDEALRELLERETQRREQLRALSSAVHMYPPDKGWVRIDPSASHRMLSLTELAILLNSPVELAGLLARLADEGEGPDEEGRPALERRFGDVARLFASIEPRLGRVLFSRLARAVLELDSVPRKRLLRETVLPGLLAGHPEAVILHDFPDPILAETLCQLLDLETAAPEVVNTALDRLELSDDRRAALNPLIEAHVQSRLSGSADAAHADLDWYTRRLTRVSAGANMEFTDFAAFDFSLDSAAQLELTGVRRAVEAADGPLVRMDFLLNLLRVEPNPEKARAVVARIAAPLHELRQQSRWGDVAVQAARVLELAAQLRERRPESAEVAEAALSSFVTRDVARALLTMHQRGGENRQTAAAVIDALGAPAGAAFLTLLDDSAAATEAEALTQLLSDRAPLYAPSLVAVLASESASVATRVRTVRILAHAGEGWEDTLATVLQTSDDAVAREALRGLARIGTARAAQYVATYIDGIAADAAAAALDALLHFPPGAARRANRAVLARTDLARSQPALMDALLDRATREGVAGFRDVLVPLARLRFRFWSPAVAALGRRAQALRRS
jgi:hypothetical protein